MLDGRTFDADEACLRERFAPPRHRARRANATRVPRPMRARAWRATASSWTCGTFRAPTTTTSPKSRRWRPTAGFRSRRSRIRRSFRARRSDWPTSSITRLRWARRWSQRRSHGEIECFLERSTRALGRRDRRWQRPATLRSHCATRRRLLPPPRTTANASRRKPIRRGFDLDPEPQRLDAASDPRTLAAEYRAALERREPGNGAVGRRNRRELRRLSRTSRARRVLAEPPASRNSADAVRALASGKYSTAGSVFRARIEPAFSQVGAARAPGRQAHRPSRSVVSGADAP